jgi:hypothetical protein
MPPPVLVEEVVVYLEASLSAWLSFGIIATEP